MKNLKPKAVHRLEVTTVIDNYVDLLLESTPVAHRPPLTTTNILSENTLKAEHGLSLLVKTFSEDTQHCILFDTGYNVHGVIHNMNLLNIDVSSIEAIVISHAQKLTGIKEVYALLGGFHLTGPAFAPIVEETIDVLLQIDPKIIIPMHCTGWHSTRKIAAAFADAFILNSVGSTYVFGG